ncbi:hypothetical protein GCM10009584_30980 [Ornithinimicrobium humiphilum]|uniref:Uncharacterized protein n=1 Tax=Ornithinimicrobium humiphilum TaxID=125288 RepID=A0A543K715_9MICO|nr:hypothetical protein [Ornithinimicrobium humiphilum]TQM90824.1 hypothetical protein FB476_3208 [Ornithinimicrobium humiphilum]
MSENPSGKDTGYDPEQDPDSDPDMLTSGGSDEDGENDRDPAEGAPEEGA